MQANNITNQCPAINTTGAEESNELSTMATILITAVTQIAVKALIGAFQTNRQPQVERQQQSTTPSTARNIVDLASQPANYSTIARGMFV